MFYRLRQSMTERNFYLVFVILWSNKNNNTFDELQYLVVLNVYDNAFERIMYKYQSYTECVKLHKGIISRGIQINSTFDFSSYVPETQFKNARLQNTQRVLKSLICKYTPMLYWGEYKQLKYYTIHKTITRSTVIFSSLTGGIGPWRDFTT